VDRAPRTADDVEGREAIRQETLSGPEQSPPGLVCLLGLLTAVKRKPDHERRYRSNNYVKAMNSRSTPVARRVRLAYPLNMGVRVPRRGPQSANELVAARRDLMTRTIDRGARHSLFVGRRRHSRASSSSLCQFTFIVSHVFVMTLVRC